MSEQALDTTITVDASTVRSLLSKMEDAINDYNTCNGDWRSTLTAAELKLLEAYS